MGCEDLSMTTMEINMQSEKTNYSYNRLAKEQSPYLLQHAQNPVDWFPWGNEAFNKAKKEDKPILLSIGYSTCHWCHVMEHESFENQAIAQKMNDYFVSIKVDREERPDVDHIYMSAVQSMTGSGGWPLTVFLTPDKEPFFGGTYFPPYEKWGSPGFMNVLESIHQSWTNRRSDVLEAAEEMKNLLSRQSLKSPGKEDQLDITIFQETLRRYFSTFDKQYGGFGSAPKFPMAHNLSLLLRISKRFEDKEAVQMVQKTLDHMQTSGTYDHLGGGFHRYSTDRIWQVPHFEKMLYDQALISKAYLEGVQYFNDETYAQTAREILDYVLRDMTDESGGFYSAEDADSLNPDDFKDMSADLANVTAEKKEGAFYIWSETELKALLDEQALNVIRLVYDIQSNGNAKQDPHGEFVGKNVFHQAQSFDYVANELSLSKQEVESILQNAKQILFKQRQKRPKPHLDDKVLVDWNGLMISSLALGGRILQEQKYLDAAQKAANFIIENMMGTDGQLFHRYRNGEVGIQGTIEDYAFFTNSLLDLYETTFDITYLEKTLELTQYMMDNFWDQKHGGFYMTEEDVVDLIVRPKEYYDGAIPSGNSVALIVLARLRNLNPEGSWSNILKEYFKSFLYNIKSNPTAYSVGLMAYDYFVGPNQQLVISTKDLDQSADQMIQSVYKRFLPMKSVIVRNDKQALDRLIKIMPFVERQVPWQNKTTAYYCENFQCQLPVTELEKFEVLLDFGHTKN